MNENRPLTYEEQIGMRPFWRTRPMHLLRLKTAEANGGDKK